NTSQRQSCHCQACRFRHTRDKAAGVGITELGIMLLDQLQRRITHALVGSVATSKPAHGSAECSALSVERCVNQRVVVEVDLAAQIKISIHPIGEMVIETV